MSIFHGFGTLTLEAIRDAIRRRIVAAIAVLSVLSLMVVDSCSGCSTGDVMVNGQAQELIQFAGYSAAVSFVVLGLWIITLAGVLAADHLTQTLEDGTALLSLTRPVRREIFALARLLGTLGIVALTGLILLGATAFLFATRNGLPLAPAAVAGAACGLGAIAVASLAMTASLFLPRLATWLLVVGAVGIIAIAGGLGLSPIENGGWLAWIGSYGPPLLHAMAVPLALWMEEVTLPTGAFDLWPRLVVWDAIGIASLCIAFRSREIST
ncbi:MAG: hypothetical protein GY723_11855 [bacterium]|nr:hypothetical protein [bacterium]MCP5066305.1 hypothetical protein [bacterium]